VHLHSYSSAARAELRSHALCEASDDLRKEIKQIPSGGKRIAQGYQLVDQRPLTTSKDHTQPTYRVHNKRHPQISDRDWMVDLVPRLSESHLAWGFTTFTSSLTPTSMQSYSLAFSRKAILALQKYSIAVWYARHTILLPRGHHHHRN
jgi:hypothetical protein